MFKKWELYIMEDNDVDGITLRTHPNKVCEGRNCCIHNPSNHHMVNWERNWRSTRRMMERICPHGVGHPDPDDAEFRASIGDTDTVHGCDGCCNADHYKAVLAEAAEKYKQLKREIAERDETRSDNM